MGDGDTRRPAWRGRLVLLAASLVLTLALAEGAARIVQWWGQPAQTPRPRPAAHTDDAPVFRSMLEIARPNLEGVHNGVPFRTNAEGVRGPAFPPRPATGTPRILFVGDSVTMGAGVLEETAYAAQVAALLGRPVETINGGLSGLNASAVMDRLERLDEAYAPDLVVYGYTINDIEGPAFVPSGESGALVRLWLRAGRFNDSPSALLRQLWPRWVMFEERLSPSLGVGEDAHVRNHLENPEAWAAVETALDRFAARTALRDRCGVVFLHTHLTSLAPDTHPYLPVYEQVGAAATARGLYAIASFPHFAGGRARAFWASFLDPHPNEAGHARLATALAEGFAKLPERCWSNGPKETPRS